MVDRREEKMNGISVKDCLEFKNFFVRIAVPRRGISYFDKFCYYGIISDVDEFWITLKTKNGIQKILRNSVISIEHCTPKEEDKDEFD